jgi:RNA polymerase sigma-70 factor, ECF subfamily
MGRAGVEAVAVRADDVDLERDRDLVHRYQAGDPRAFDELYRRYFDRLHGYCHRRVGDRHTAEELAQEAFVRALRAMPRFAGERRFYPWMTVIAQRLCIDHHRRSGRVEPADDIDAGSVEPDHDFLFRAVDLDHLGQALERLAPRHREVLDLRETEGLAYAQIAEQLQVPLSTVEALLHRARKALRREYRAVAGRDRAWGLPILGGLLSRMGWRQVDPRVPELAGWVAPAVAAAVTVVVLALPGVADRSTTTPDAEAATLVSTAPTTTTSTSPSPEPTEAVELPALVLPPSPVAPVAVIAPPGPAPGPLPEPDVAAGPVRAYTDPASVAEVAEHTETMPVNGRVADAFYGLDPTAPVRNLGEALDQLTDHTPGGLP